jgi:hypothetical protein
VHDARRRILTHSRPRDLFDHFVGEREEWQRNFKPERPGSAAERDEGLPFKVVRGIGDDEVNARPANLLVGRAAYETAARLFAAMNLSAFAVH